MTELVSWRVVNLHMVRDADPTVNCTPRVVLWIASISCWPTVTCHISNARFADSLHIRMFHGSLHCPTCKHARVHTIFFSRVFYLLTWWSLSLLITRQIKQCPEIWRISLLTTFLKHTTLIATSELSSGCATTTTTLAPWRLSVLTQWGMRYDDCGTSYDNQ